MLAKIIQWCAHNRMMVLLLTGFLVAGGVWSTYRITVDAIPDLSDVQVVVRTQYPGQAPQIVEDQVTYPMTTAMLSVPNTKVVRGYSMFGTSFVYVIFEDGTDMYWARSRVLEQLNFASGQLPQGVKPQIGPDATGVGWIYQYVLTTGPYCPEHPNGAWFDPHTQSWHAAPSDAPLNDAQRQRLLHYRVFPANPATAPPEREGQTPVLEMAANSQSKNKASHHRVQKVPNGLERCPLDGAPLKEPAQDLSDLRGLQDWYLRYELTAVDGVSEIAPVGGFEKQYQVVVDPVKLQAYDVSLSQVQRAVKQTNEDVGGRLIEWSETEYMVRGLGYLGRLSSARAQQIQSDGGALEEARTNKALDELRNTALRASEEGEPVYLADVAHIQTGPEIRRGIAEWNGQGEAVGGIVVMRYGENAAATIERVKTQLEDLEKGLPPGVAVKTAYDRSDLIHRSINTLKHTLIEEIVIVAVVCILFLLHARSALVAAFVLPTGVLGTIGLMHALNINANIMSLGGIAISIGVMVDSAIIMIENAHKHMEFEKHRVAAGHPPRPRARVVAEAAAEVGPSLFFALLIIVVSFLPIFVLGGQSGRMFKPLAYTKTFAMGWGAILAVTVIPVLMVFFVSERVVPRAWKAGWRWLIYGLAIVAPTVTLALIPLPRFGDYRWWLVGGWALLSGLMLLPQKIPSEHRNPLSRVLEALYNPFFALVMRFRWLTVIGALALVAVTWWPFSQLGSEFMPPLNEGDLLYMPTTDPGISTGKAKELLQQTDKLIQKFPEVKTTFGKVGRAESATDPAPMSMLETTIMLHRDKSKWRHVPRRFEDWPWGTRWIGRWALSDRRPITVDELRYGYELPDGTRVPGLNDVVNFPGLTNAWTMPIKTRIDMLSTGIKTPVGIKVLGPDLRRLSDLAGDVAQALNTDPRTSEYTVSAFPDKSVGGHYFDIDIDRKAIARYGLRVSDVQDVIKSAMGGMNVTHTVEGLQRYPVNVRYPRELRDNLPQLKQTLVSTSEGQHIPLAQLADFEIHKGPPMIKTENARPTSWVAVDIKNLDVGTYVQRAQQVIGEKVAMPTGYSLQWSGQYEYMQRARQRLMIAVPLAVLLIILLLYIGTRSWVHVGIVLLSLPFSLVGAIWLLWAMDYNLSLAVWVGMIALAGLAAETGIVMLLYLQNSVDRFKAAGRMRNTRDLWHAVHDGAVKRIRPKTMTIMAIFMGLLPLLWASGAGADTMRRLAVPMIGGVGTSFVLELLVFPILFYLLLRARLRREFQQPDTTIAPTDTKVH
jgi:Cu(I)/Ag(I) efflux system membrane protein CusA/SilA